MGNISLTFEKFFNLILGKLSEWTETAVSMLPNLFLALVVFLIFYIVARYVRKYSRKGLDHFHGNVAVNNLLTNFTFLSIIFFGLFATLSILKLDKTVTSLLAGAGVLGLALGFAFQEIASNFIAGILIAFREPYRVGDIILIDKYMGEVSEIDLRTTRITTFQGIEVIIPNKDLFTKPFENYTSTPKLRVDLNVGISYGDDLRKVEKIVKKALEDVPHRDEEQPIDFFYEEFGSSSINFSSRVWIKYPGRKNFLEARHMCVILIKEAFDQNDITIPFPIRTLDFGIKGGMQIQENLSSLQAFNSK